MGEQELGPNWESIAEDIRDGMAILLLGPDAFKLHNVEPDPEKMDLHEITFKELCRDRIEKNKEISLKSIYKPDNFFLFQDNNSKKKAKRIVSSLAKDMKWRPDEDLLTKICEIPFSVIISVNPDLYLHEYFGRYDIQYQHDYFSFLDNKTEKVLEEPSIRYPLIYNLCGSVEEPNSLILDYYDLFRLMRNLLGEIKFSQKLKFKLKNATTYIFLGFQFDRWYSQMMLYYLNMLDNDFDNSSNNYSMFSQTTSDDNLQFIIKQFNIQYIGTDKSDFDRLYATCQNKELLRTLLVNYSDKEIAVKMKVEADDLNGAFDILENCLSETEHQNGVIILRSRLRHWETQKRQKTMKDDDLNIERNQIRYAIIEFARFIK